MMIAICFYKEITFYLSESPLTRIYARLAIKGEERNARLAKLHKMPSSVVSILFLGASRPYRSARPTDFHLIPFRFKTNIRWSVSSLHEMSIWKSLDAEISSCHFSRRPLPPSDFILSLREDMGGRSASIRNFRDVQLLNRYRNYAKKRDRQFIRSCNFDRKHLLIE